MPGERRRVADQVGVDVDDRQIPAQAGGLGDHVGVFGVGLAFAGVGRAHRRNDSRGGITHRLVGSSQQRQQQRRRRADDIDGPIELSRLGTGGGVVQPWAWPADAGLCVCDDRRGRSLVDLWTARRCSMRLVLQP